MRELLFRKNQKAESVWEFTFKFGSSNILNVYSNKNSWSQRWYIFRSIWYDFTRNSNQMYLIYESGIPIDWRRDIVYFIRYFFCRCHRFFSFAGLASFSNRFGCHNSYRILLNKTACMTYLDESERILWHTEMYKYITHQPKEIRRANIHIHSVSQCQCEIEKQNTTKRPNVFLDTWMRVNKWSFIRNDAFVAKMCVLSKHKFLNIQLINILFLGTVFVVTIYTFSFEARTIFRII